MEPPPELAISYRDPGDPDLRQALVGAVGLVLPSAGGPLPRGALQGAHDLRLVQYTGAGWDRIPTEALEAIGASVANAAGGNAAAVAQYVLLAAGFLLRRLGTADGMVRTGDYRGARSALEPDRVWTFEDLTVGIVGLGHIGTEVARLFLAAGARSIFYDPEPRGSGAEGTLTRCRSLQELVVEADVITVHVPLTRDTRGLLSGEVLRSAKRGAVLIQASRGGIVDELAALDLVSKGQLGGAAFDVFEEEPLPLDSPLLRAVQTLDGRVLLTPHVAGVSYQSSRRLYEKAWENVVGVLVEGGRPRGCVFCPTNR
ncbi:MAG: NAD(P)-dependent oxidoreductase [Chloroflexota bacterium]